LGVRRIAWGALVGHIGAGALVACSDPASDEVGPFTGQVHRFVVDRVDVPREAQAADAVASDLDGDKALDNKFGYATAVLATTNDLSPHSDQMIASGALAPVIEIQADDLQRDDSVGIRYFTHFPDAESVLVGGRIAGGAFSTDRRTDTKPGCCVFAALPVFVNADPVVLAIDDMRLELQPDGAGGYEGIMRGGIVEETARGVAYGGLMEMSQTEPERHLVFLRTLDTDHDGDITFEEVEASVLGLLVSADLALFGTTDDSVSIAFSMHLTPCADGLCRATPPEVTCRNRVRDGNESDIDCGGSCQACATLRSCNVAGDCQSNACDGGSCRAPTCNDGERDGFESDVDCGGGCPVCATGRSCAADWDCASNDCNNGVGTLGTCQ
jgi:hypothetical protein